MAKASLSLQRLSRYLLRYGLGVVSVGVALLITELLMPALKAAPSPVFFAAVMITAWYGGVGPGILASLLATITIDYFFLSPVYRLSEIVADVPLFSVSALISILISTQSAKRKRIEEALRQSRDELEQRVERRTKELAKTNHSLESEIIERKRSGEALRESEQRYRELFENANDIVYTLDISGNLTSLNRAGERIMGYSREEFLGKPIGQIVVPEYIDRMREMMERKMAGETLTTYEIEITTKDGRRVALEVSSRLVYEQGKAAGIQGIARDITERKKSEAELRDKEDRLRLAIESAALGTWDFNVATGMLSWDNACKAIFDLPPGAEVTFDLFASAIHPEDRARTLAIIRHAFNPETGGEYDTEYRILGLRDGIERWVAARGQVFFNESGKATRFIGTVLDITERKRAEQERARLLAREKAARVEAEEANRLKDEFLATVSHELRTPLNAILGWAELIRGGKLDSNSRESGLETIIRNAKSQANLIEDLLDVSRIITGKLRLESKDVWLAWVLDAAVETVRPAAYAKDITIATSFDRSDTLIWGDPNRLQQIVWNLLSNAIKFTPNGGRVEVRLEHVGDRAQVIVSDTGCGINKEFLPHVFDHFRQADSSYTRAHGGLGLGLAIVRHLAEMHGGSVEVESDGEGLGATFTVNLPLRQSRSADHTAQPQSRFVKVEDSKNFNPRDSQASLATRATRMNVSRSEILSGLWLLIVDDEPDALDLITATLKQYGAEVTATASAAEALGALAKNADWRQPDVILSDIGMPGDDGLALIAEIRSMEPKECRQIPAIALTAYARAEDRERALQAGFQTHIAKPFDPVDLVEAIVAIAGRNDQS